MPRTLWETVAGCTAVSPGCANCFAARAVATTHRHQSGYQGLAVLSLTGTPKWTGNVNVLESQLDAPKNFTTPSMVYCNLMSDTFHESVGFEFINKIVDRAAAHPQHVFQFLTRRSERMMRFCRARAALPANLWLGVSVENRASARRIDHLRQCNGAVRFVSFEPLLEDVGDVDLSGVDWAMIGLECGPGARRGEWSWVKSLSDHCRAHDVPVMIEQLGPNDDSRAHWDSEYQLHEWPK